MKHRHSRGGWEPHRDRWSSDSSDGAWNQSWQSRDQDPYSDYRSGQLSSFSYDWQRKVTPYRPQSIHTAVVLMCMGAGVSVLGLLYNLVGNHWGGGYGAVTLNSGSTSLMSVASAVSSIGSDLGSVIVIALWLWLASATSAGRGWARIFVTVLFAFSTLGAAAFMYELRSYWHVVPGADPLPTPLLVAGVFSLVYWVFRLVIVVLLWSRESSAYFRAKAAGW